MNNIREYLEFLFRKAEDSAKKTELINEMEANLTERYNDYMKKGLDEDEAFRDTIASIGDISDLVESLPKKKEENKVTDSKVKNKTALLKSIAIVLFIGCPVPTLVLSKGAGDAGLLAMVAVGVGLMIYANRLKK